VETRDAWHLTDWEEFKRNPKSLELPRPEWIFGHKPQAYAYEEFEKAAHSVETGCEYTPRNIPPAGVNHRTDDFDAREKSLSKVNGRTREDSSIIPNLNTEAGA
jgi:hypothetical protein